ncbi:MAG: energy transducer TonB [Flavobacterium sp.]
MKLDILKGHWIEMLFEGRNKNYGAYVLRKESPKTTMLAWVIGTSLFTGLLALPLLDWSKEEEVIEEKVTLVDMANIEAPEKQATPNIPPPPPPPPAPKIDEVKFVKPEVVDKAQVVEEIKTMEELKDKNVGSKDIKGRGDEGKILIDEPAGESTVATQVVEDETVYNSVEVSPDFPGGMKKFYEYVGKNFRSPEEEGVFGRIIVQFVVEKDGNLTDIVVLRDIGYGTGKEAIRVLKNSPKWKPGINNGRPVRVKYSLPITIQPPQN